MGAFPGQLCAQAVTAGVEAGGVEEIIITAQRREENLQDVPIAVLPVSDTGELRFSALYSSNSG